MAGSFSTGFSTSFDAVSSSGGPWTPDMAWPSDTPGGAARPEWGGYVRFWLLAEIAAGTPFHVGAHTADRLDAGNVVASPDMTILTSGSLPVTSGLWVDLTCDLVDCEFSAGAGLGGGVLSRAEAGTLSATLYDPTGKYDPYNPDTVYALSGRSRLVPGVRILALAEVVDAPSTTPPHVRQWTLFTGTADKWSEDWAKEPGDRRARLTATDFTKNLVKMDRPEQAPQGDGEPVLSRMNRIADYFGFPRPQPVAVGGEATRTLQATTLAQSAWELLNRTIDDELGYLWVGSGDGVLRYTTRETWTARYGYPLNLGCGDPATFYDIVTDATPTTFDTSLVNTVHAARSGGTSQTAANTQSVAQWGEHSVNRTDLGLADDPQVAAWAGTLVNLQAFPRYAVDRVTLVPAVGRSQWACWSDVLNHTLSPGGYGFVLGLYRIVYQSDRFDYTVDVTVRLVGYTHRLDPGQWAIEMHTVDASVAAGGTTFHMGVHTQDRLDAGNVAA